MEQETREAILDAIAKETSQVWHPVGFLSGVYTWDDLQTYLPDNLEYAREVATVAVLALARYFGFETAEQMLALLEANGGKHS
jgi:hypothetical protein